MFQLAEVSPAVADLREEAARVLERLEDPNLTAVARMIDARVDEAETVTGRTAKAYTSETCRATSPRLEHRFASEPGIGAAWTFPR
jgi:hypothetical protein